MLKFHQVSWKQLLNMQIWNIDWGMLKMHAPCMNRPLQLKKEKNIPRPCPNCLLNTLDLCIWYLLDRQLVHLIERYYPLRPELAESTFDLYQATKDPMNYISWQTINLEDLCAKNC